MATSEGRPPADNAAMLQGRFRGLRPRGDGAKMAFVLPIRIRPAGARRLKQKATGIMATVVNGEVVLRDNEPTGALPGQLIRGTGACR